MKKKWVVFFWFFMLFLLMGCSKYEVAFDSVGGPLIDSVTVKSKDTIDLPFPVKEGFIFLGWYLGSGEDAAQFTDKTKVTEDTNLIAKWSRQSYTITFVSNGGSAINPITQYYDYTITPPTTPTREGYVFSGWFLDENLLDAYTFGAMPSHAFTLYSKWEVAPDPEPGEVFDTAITAILEVPNMVDIVSDGQRVYYVFTVEETDWYTIQAFGSHNSVASLYNNLRSSLVFRFSGGYGDNFLITRQLQAGITYYLEVGIQGNGTGTFDVVIEKEVTYNFVSNGGSSVSSQTRIRVPYIPISYKFEAFLEGWYETSDFSGNPITFPYRSSTNITLYAKWSDTLVPHGTTTEGAFRVLVDEIYDVFSTRGYYYKFIPEETATYIIESYGYMNTNMDIHIPPHFALFGQYATGGEANNFRAVVELEAGATYYLWLTTYYSGDAGPFTFNVTKQLP